MNTTADAVPAPAECAGAPGDCSLRQAVDRAAPGDTVSLPPGMYTTNVAIEITRAVRVAGAGARVTIVTGVGANRLFTNLAVGATVTISGITMTGGLAQLQGGAVLNDAGASLVLERVAVRGNTAAATPFRGAGGGGGIFNGGSLTITDSTVSANTASPSGRAGGSGGGILNAGGRVKLINTTVSGNRADSNGLIGAAGGGIANNSGQVSLLNSTLYGNVAQAGSGVPSGAGNLVAGDGGTVTLRNTLVAGGVADTNPNCFGSAASLVSQGHNLEDRNQCRLGAGELRNAAPRLGPLQDNGGQTDTHALASGSPAIGAADARACPAADQRGLPRLGADGDTGCDIGAFELQGPPGGSIGGSRGTAHGGHGGAAGRCGGGNGGGGGYGVRRGGAGGHRGCLRRVIRRGRVVLRP